MVCSAVDARPQSPNEAILSLPPSVSHISVLLPDTIDAEAGTAVRLTAESAALKPTTGWVFAAPSTDGSRDSDERRLVARLAPAISAEVLLRLRPEARPATDARSPTFRFQPVDDRSLGLWEGDRPVLVYNHGIMSKPGVPADRNRSTYIHPLYGLDGEVLTDDFPVDHYHHRGLFWAWPHVKTAGREHDLWMIQGIHQRFENWLARETHGEAALLAVENGWYTGDRKVLQERVWILVHQADNQSRCIDLEFFWVPVEQPVSLAGAEGKSYGGLTLRYAPRTGTVITTPLGNGPDDLQMTALPWADLSAVFEGANHASGAALFIHRDHPGYPPTWLTRHYGALCIGWPGVDAQEFPVRRPIHCRYRVWVHRDMPSQTAIAAAYSAYTAENSLRWN